MRNIPHVFHIFKDEIVPQGRFEHVESVVALQALLLASQALVLFAPQPPDLFCKKSTHQLTRHYPSLLPTALDAILDHHLLQVHALRLRLEEGVRALAAALGVPGLAGRPLDALVDEGFYLVEDRAPRAVPLRFRFLELVQAVEVFRAQRFQQAEVGGVGQPYEYLLDFREHPRLDDAAPLVDAGVVEGNVGDAGGVAELARFVVFVIRVGRQFAVGDAVSYISNSG